MTQAVWDELLETARAAHTAPAVAGFVDFPTDISRADVSPFRAGGADLMEADEVIRAAPNPLAQGFLAAASIARWYEPYPDNDLGGGFAHRYAVYCLIGPEGRQEAPFRSRQMAAYVIYMPPGLHYPWHHHQGEELYTVLAGEAEFLRASDPPETLSPGRSIEHAAWEPHAMTTYDHPVMAYVIWRTDLTGLPQLTAGAS